MRPVLVLLLVAAACASSQDDDAEPGATSPDVARLPDTGALRMFEHVPAGAGPGAPLVVALHGCTQSAAGYASLAGWVTLSDRLGFALLLPEAPSAAGCFAWYDAAEVARGRGQAASIAQSVDWMVVHRGVDPARVFVAGFSAGGYMATALLAAYPDVFAAGAVFEGGPAGCDATCMAFPERSPRAWADAVERADPGYDGPRPRLLAFHGRSDLVVTFWNLHELVEQWTAVHGADGVPDRSDRVRGQLHEVFTDADGAAVVETYTSWLGHAIVVDPGDGPEQGGQVGPFAIDGDLWSSLVAARFFGID